MTHQVKPIPEGFHTVTPHLVIKGAAEAIEFYKKAFGAEEISKLPGADGRLMHAAVKIGDSIVFLVDEAPTVGKPRATEPWWNACRDPPVRRRCGRRFPAGRSRRSNRQDAP
jgi:hypothetical protein